MINSDIAFALEGASWPALLVDASGQIRAASVGAAHIFGPVISTQPNLASSIWSSENPQSPEDFFATQRGLGDRPFAMRLKSRDGSTATWQMHICTFPAEGENLFLLQAFRTAREGTAEAGSDSLASGARRENTPLMEASLAQKQKLDCAMQLIRTVALDFNNALTGILGHASLLLGKAEARGNLRSSLVEIEKSAQRAAEITSDLAAFSRQDKDAKAQTRGNLNDVLRRTIDYYRQAQPDTVSWLMDLQNRPYSANFDEAKIQQAFVKILENAVQAMDASGTICVSTRNLDLVEAFEDGNVKLAPGAYICIEIEDTGKGIPTDVLPRIFEPFFTTRQGLGHRGLGLAWVYGIVTNHGGSVAVSTELNKGTTFRVYLPAQKKTVHDRGPETDDLNGTETILMIDDEDLLLTMGEMVLSSFGYKVLTANSGKRGLEIFAERSKEIDLVITDLVMPQMSGREVIERLRQICPKVKILCASGFVRPQSNEESENYLQKPFASQDLLRKVKQVLSIAVGEH